MCILDTNYFFSGDFQGQEGVCIMHQCALYNPKYSSLVLFDAQLDLFIVYIWMNDLSNICNIQKINHFLILSCWVSQIFVLVDWGHIGINLLCNRDNLTLLYLVEEYNMTFKSTPQGQNTFEGLDIEFLQWNLLKLNLE
jgi:hypothetical protein